MNRKSIMDTDLSVVETEHAAGIEMLKRVDIDNPNIDSRTPLALASAYFLSALVRIKVKQNYET